MSGVRFSSLILLITFFLNPVYSQTVTYQGPASGSVPSGIVISTDNFALRAGEIEPIFSPKIRETMEFHSEVNIMDVSGLLFDEYTYVEDLNTSSLTKTRFGESFELNSYQAFMMSEGQGIPPDPHVAVGPNHVVATINSRFKIFDRNGNVLKSIIADNFFTTLLPNADTFDPQIIYDHFDNRWFMLWDNQNDATFTSNFLIAVSDDSDPLGIWYTYALPSNKNGSTVVTNWGDFPQVGFDDKAIYISSRQFNFTGGYAGMKIRILNKSELYASNAGPLSWTDLWDIRLLNGFQTDDLIPVISYDTGLDFAYFIIADNASNYYGFYKISNPLTNPVLTGINLFVPFWFIAPRANQLGGGTPLIDTGPNGSGMRNAPVIRDGKLYGVHHIRNSQFPSYGSIKYFVIDISSNSVIEQAELGAEGYFYIYPAITVDKDHNIAITYTRTADNEYAGSFYSTKLSVDPPGLSPSKLMAEGNGNYIVTFGGSLNRWGDYLSAFLDPINQYNIYLFSQYVAATNQFATWLTEIRMKPYEGAHVHTNTPVLDFGRIEVGFDSDTISAYLANYGDTDLIISNIPDSTGAFHLVSEHTFPITVPFNNSIQVKFQFKPGQLGQLDQLYPITNNSSNFTGFNLKGYGFIVFPAESNKYFAISGPANNGELLSINSANGTGTNLGPSLFNDLNSLSINPKTKFIYGMRTSGINSEIIRINAQDGDGYKLFEIGLPNLFSMAFDSSGQMYVVSTSGQIYSVDTNDGSFTSVSQIPVSRVSIAFNHLNNELWGTVKNITGAVRDRLIKIDLLTGDTTIVGQTGFGVNTVDLAFNSSGELYGIKGNNISPNDFFMIDQTTGIGTLVGSVGIPDLKGLAFSTDISSSIDGEDPNLPESYSLEQNFPNPFNPITNIKFSIPNSANVKLTIYNLLGESVNVLLEKELQSGSYNVIWNADDQFGRKVSSGVYFYELRASSEKGSDFNQIRKMILLK